MAARIDWKNKEVLRANPYCDLSTIKGGLAATIGQKNEEVSRANLYSDLSTTSRKVAKDQSGAEAVRAMQPMSRNRRLGPGGSSKGALVAATPWMVEAAGVERPGDLRVPGRSSGIEATL